MRAQVHEQAAVRVVGAELTGRADDECGLADSGRTVHGHDRHGSGRGRRDQFRQLGLPPDQAAGVTRQFVHRAAGAGAGAAGRRGRTEETVVVPAQHRFVDTAQFITGIDPELVAQAFSYVLIDAQRLRLTFAAVQGAHAQRRQRLVARFGRGQAGEFVQRVGEPGQKNQAFEPLQPDRAPALQQPLPLGVGERARQPGQRLAVEQGERGRQPVHRGGRISAGLRVLSAVDLLGEVRHIEPDLVDGEAVPARFPADHRLRGSGALRIERLP